MTDVLSGVTDAVTDLQATYGDLLDACTDPEATDMAELLLQVQQARIVLQQVERDVEYACAKAMLGDQALTPTLRVERYRSTDRKSWDHESWQRDVAAKALQAAGLKGCQGVLSADGEVLPATALGEALAAVQAAHSATGPRTTALKALGLDPSDYCETSRGAWHVKVQRMADETETTDSEVA